MTWKFLIFRTVMDQSTTLFKVPGEGGKGVCCDANEVDNV